MPKYDTMENILADSSVFDTNRKIIQKISFVKKVIFITDRIVRIIDDNYEKNGEIIKLSNKLTDSINKIGDKDIIQLIKEVDEISLTLLLITSLLNNYASRLHFNASMDHIAKCFEHVDKLNKEKYNKPVYNRKNILKAIRKLRQDLINKFYIQSKNILRCFALYVSIPELCKKKLKYIKNENDTLENSELTKKIIYELNECLYGNRIINKEYRKIKFEVFIRSISKIGDFIIKTIKTITGIFFDIFAFLYFLFHGIKLINNLISDKEKQLRKNFDEIIDMTTKITDTINNSDIIPDLVKRSESLEGFDYDKECERELLFSKSTIDYVNYCDKHLANIVSNYTNLRKYLYVEKDFLDNIKK